MAIMMGKLYAAEEVATYENRLAKIDSDLLLLKWMLATTIALILAAGGLLLRVAGKVGAL